MTIKIENNPGPPQEAPPRAMLSEDLLWRIQDAAAALVVETFRSRLGFLPGSAAERASAAVFDFFELYETRPVRENAGGSGFNDSLWLYVLTRGLAPEFIIESGVHRGHSTWLLRQACPHAAMMSFDVDLSKRVYHDDKADYFEHDWMETEALAPKNKKTLIFFDDHISHARRLHEARDRGFRFLLFDDNFAAQHLYATGGPPVPTLAMIMDADLAPGRNIVWTRNGKTYSYQYDLGEVREIRELIEFYEVMPELAPITRYSPGSGLSLVKLA